MRYLFLINLLDALSNTRLQDISNVFGVWRLILRGRGHCWQWQKCIFSKISLFPGLSSLVSLHPCLTSPFLLWLGASLGDTELAAAFACVSHSLYANAKGCFSEMRLNDLGLLPFSKFPGWLVLSLHRMEIPAWHCSWCSTEVQDCNSLKDISLYIYPLTLCKNT